MISSTFPINMFNIVKIEKVLGDLKKSFTLKLRGSLAISGCV